MRLWLKDAERRPDPEVVATDDRKAMLVGTAGWLAALVLLLALVSESPSWLLTCAIGIGLGLLGLIYTHRRHH
ncbi:MAG: hypothetical protein JWL94_428 [Microbacteriaceae bacterium]|jgi:hypothetical protein|nr:hypothetical protein [Microbacteriaceae bacterium]